MRNSISSLKKQRIDDLRQIAKSLNVANYTTLTKPFLIEEIMKFNEPSTAPTKKDAPAKNMLRISLNGKPLQEFSIVNKDVTTIQRFFNKFGMFAQSTKDELILEVNGKKINYFEVRKKINRLIQSNFVEHTAHSFWNSEKKRFENVNDEAVKNAVKFIREGVAMTYESVNNFLTMDAADFREALKNDEVFNEYISASENTEAIKLLTY